MSKKNLFLLIAGAFLLLTPSCTTTKPKGEQPATGKVSVFVEKEIADKKTGDILIQTERLEEIAERSTMDKGAEALLTPQRFANIGSYFESYSVGPNNQILASIHNQEGKSGSDLWIFKAGRMRLTKSNLFNRYPSFSASGKNVYFVASRGQQKSMDKYEQNSYIWRMPSDGSGGFTRIGTPAYHFLDPIESPDGSRILFSSREFFENSPFIWYMQQNGALPTQLKQGHYANWLDSNRIVFSAKDENTGLYSVWTSRIDGSNLTQIISDNEMDCIYPVANPSGEWIAYVKQAPNRDRSLEAQSRDIHVFGFRDGLSQQITTNISRDDMPRWSPEGDYLYFRSSRGLAWNIWRLDTAFLSRQ